MCGIVGFWMINSSEFGEPERVATRMALAIRHRGPNSAGAWADREAGVALGHRRLSIIDLSPAGHQPMHSSCGRYVLIFNGEIYNHLALRAELENAGQASQWRGHSDTETLLACITQWGVTNTLQRAVGMFALALWDRRERRLTLARDRFGEKPLYYGWVGQGAKRAFVFGSELKALRAYPSFSNPVSRNSLSLYLQFCVVPAPYSIYHDIFKLPPGSILTLQVDQLAHQIHRIEPYWRLTDVVKQGLAHPIKNEADGIRMLHDALRDAVALQAIADVPLGAFLSGGVDSSTIVALMQSQSTRPVKTFTVGFDEAGFDESSYAAAVARHLGTDHHELRVSPTDAQAVIPLLPALYDEPFADSSQIPTYLVCKMTSQYVTVALSGDGGDELFAGYNRYFWGQRVWDRLSWLPLFLRKGVGAGILQLPVSGWDALADALPIKTGVSRLGDKAHKLARRLKTIECLDDLYRSLVTEWPLDPQVVINSGRLPTLLDDEAAIGGIVEAENRMMVWDSLTYLPDDILTKVDRAAMGVSIETRVPFLDRSVAEVAWRLPLHMKIRGAESKWALRQVLFKYVPRDLIERPKAGFGIPIGEWLRGPLREWAEDLLKESRLQQEGYFNPAPIRDAWRQHLSGRHDWTNRLWCILMFQAWLGEGF